MPVFLRGLVICGAVICILAGMEVEVEATSPLCASSANNQDYEWVVRVKIDDGEVNSGKSGYSDFTDTPIATLTAGQTYDIEVDVATNGTQYLEYVKIWFDMNQNDAIEDPDELIFDVNKNVQTLGTFYASVTIPNDIYNGQIFVRMIMQYNASPTLCGTYTYGETEDYLVNVVGGQSNPLNKTLTAVVAGEGTGGITSAPAGIDTLNGYTSFEYSSGESVTLAATPTNGSSFTGWSGDASGTANPLSIIMDADKSIIATFGPPNALPAVQSSVITNVGQAKAGEPVYDFSITYTDSDGAVQNSSISNGDILITGPNSFSASPVVLNAGATGATLSAEYRLTPPGGSWDDSDNGTYTISVVPNEVLDDVGGAVMSGPVGTFSVAIDTTCLPPSVPDLAAGSDTGSSSTDDITADNTPDFSGAGEEGATVTLFTDDNNNGILDAGESLGTAVVSGGSWSITVNTLLDGEYLIRARQTDVAENTSTASDSATVTIITSCPAPGIPDLAALSDSGHSDSDNITNSSSLEFSGTGTALSGSTIELFNDSDEDGVVDPLEYRGTGSVVAGMWTISSTVGDEGTWKMRAIQTDVAGNVSLPSGFLFVEVDRTRPTDPVCLDPASGIYRDASQYTVSGTHSEDGVYVNLYIDSPDTINSPDTATVLDNASVSESNWSLQAPLTQDFNNEFLIRAFDKAGNYSYFVALPTISEDSTDPVITSPGNTSVNENSNAGTIFFRATADDLSPIVFSEVSGSSGESLFAIDSVTGQISVSPGAELNFESTPSYTYNYKVTDSVGKSATHSLAIAINDINEAPQITSNGGLLTASVVVDENTTAVTTVTAADEDGDILRFHISGGSDAGYFALDEVNGALTFIAAPDFELPQDANGDNDYEVEVTVIDGGAVGSLSDSQTILVTVQGVNEPPTADNDSIMISEDSGMTDITSQLLDGDSDPDAFTILEISSFDATDTYGDVTLHGGALMYGPAGRFEVLSAEETVEDSFVYSISDGEFFDQALVTITIQGENDPTTLSGSAGGIWESSPVQVFQGVYATDPDINDTYGNGFIVVELDNYLAGDTLYLDAYPTGVITTFGGDEQALVVILNAWANAYNIGAIYEAVRYDSTAQDPTGGGAYPTRSITGHFTDDNGEDATNSISGELLLNRKPNQVVLMTPVAFDGDPDSTGSTLNPAPCLIWESPSDPDGDDLHFIVELDTGEGMATVADTRLDPTGFAWDSDGDGAFEYPVSFPIPHNTGRLRYRIQPDDGVAAGQTVDWTVFADDTIISGPKADIRSFVVADLPTALQDDALFSADMRIRKPFIDTLRVETNRLRLFDGLPAFTFTEEIIADSTIIRDDHIQQLRQAMAEALQAQGLPEPVYAQGAITAEETLIKASDFTEIRDVLINH